MAARMSETPLTDTPLYAATLSDALSSARDRVDRAQQRAAEAERRAADVVAKVQAQLAQAERVAKVRQALLADQVADKVEEQVLTRLALGPPSLPELEDGMTEQLSEPYPTELEREAPPVPSMAELLLPSPGVTRFLDALLGPTEP